MNTIIPTHTITSENMIIAIAPNTLIIRARNINNPINMIANIINNIVYTASFHKGECFLHEKQKSLSSLRPFSSLESPHPHIVHRLIDPCFEVVDHICESDYHRRSANRDPN